MNISEYIEKVAPKFKTVDTETGRKYQTPTGNFYYSVTTVLQQTKDTTFLDKWKLSIGEEKAEEIKNYAKNRGTNVHTLIESFLEGKNEDKSTFAPSELRLYNSLKPFLKKIDCSQEFGIEIPVWSDKLKIAGKLDFAGVFDSKWSIVDFKTSSKERVANQIEDYFIQASLYAMMFSELLNSRTFSNIAILIAVEGGIPQLFQRNPRHFVKLALDRVNQFFSGDKYKYE